MVVKAFFIGSICGRSRNWTERGNPRLARMLVDLAQERWAAGRPVSGEVWRCVAPHADAEGVAALVRAFETGSDKERSSVALALQQAQPDRVDAAFEQRDLRRPGQGHPIALGGRKDRLESARMSEWSSPFLSRTLLRTLSALLTICLLAQFFIAGIAAMTDPSWWTYHSDWVAIFQWLVIPLPILAWLGGSSSWAAHTIRMHSPAAGRVAICVGAPRNRRPPCDWSGPARLGCRTTVVDRCRAGSWFVRLTKLIV